MPSPLPAARFSKQWATVGGVAGGVALVVSLAVVAKVIVARRRAANNEFAEAEAPAAGLMTQLIQTAPRTDESPQERTNSVETDLALQNDLVP
jgi:hypothetical protein